MRFTVFSLLFLATAAPAFAAPLAARDAACPMPTMSELRDQACDKYPHSHLCSRLQNGTATETPEKRKFSIGRFGDGVDLFCKILPETCQSADDDAASVIGSLKVRGAAPTCAMPTASELRDDACKQYPNSHLCTRLSTHVAVATSLSKGKTVSRRQGAIGLGIDVVSGLCSIFSEVCQDVEQGAESIFGSFL